MESQGEAVQCGGTLDPTSSPYAQQGLSVWLLPHTSVGLQSGEMGRSAPVMGLLIYQSSLGLAGRIILINTPIIAAAPRERVLI